MTPTFQAQNPAISGYSLGWSSCTAFSAAMAASFDRQVAKLCTGGQVRAKTGDTVGGLTLAQVDDALNRGWAVDLNTVYRGGWADFVKRIDAGCAAILQGSYAPIADSRFDAGGGFRGNHAVTVLPGWIVMDPLADGRRSGIYKYHGEAYPQPLLREFAGRLNIGVVTPLPLGLGLVYASFTRDNVHTYRASVDGRHGVYTVMNGVITAARVATGTYSATCTPPHVYPWPGHSSAQTLVRLTSGSHAGRYIQASKTRMVP
jgi:hypothetical protein